MAEKKKDNFFESSLCGSGEACERCRLFGDYRQALGRIFDIADIDQKNEYAFKCPKGKVAEEFEKTEFPTALAMMKSLAAEAVAQVKHTVKTGKGLARKETQEERINICKECKMFIPARSRCRKCGCRLLAKIKLSGFKCPIGKWGPESVE